MSTVRKHNRSIYEKLGVASRDELMLYIDLLRRCGGFRSFSDARITIRQRAQNRTSGFVRVCHYPMDTLCKIPKSNRLTIYAALCSCYNRSRNVKEAPET